MTKITYNIEDKGWKKHFPHFKKYIGQAVNETLKQMDIKIDEDIVVSIFLTSNNEIKKLNNQYRNKNKPTNVLSFPMQSTSDGIHLLGDIVLSNQTLLEESIEQKIKKYDHLCKMTNELFNVLPLIKAKGAISISADSIFLTTISDGIRS